MGKAILETSSFKIDGYIMKTLSVFLSSILQVKSFVSLFPGSTIGLTRWLYKYCSCCYPNPIFPKVLTISIISL